MSIVLYEFSDHLADLYGRGVFNETDPEKTLRNDLLAALNR